MTILDNAHCSLIRTEPFLVPCSFPGDTRNRPVTCFICAVRACQCPNQFFIIITTFVTAWVCTNQLVSHFYQYKHYLTTLDNAHCSLIRTEPFLVPCSFPGDTRNQPVTCHKLHVCCACVSVPKPIFHHYNNLCRSVGHIFLPAVDKKRKITDFKLFSILINQMCRIN